MEDIDDDYPTPGIEFNVSMATNNDTNIDNSLNVDQYLSSDGSVMSVDENIITEDGGNSVPEADWDDDDDDGNSVLEADWDDDAISILHQRVNDSVEVDTDISQSKKQLDSAINLLGETVDLLQQNNVAEAKQHCYEAYDILNGINDPKVVRGQLEAYTTCCNIFQKVWTFNFLFNCILHP